LGLGDLWALERVVFPRVADDGGVFDVLGESLDEFVVDAFLDEDS
jgi:hypothetical protein